MSIVEMLQIANEKDAGGDLVPASNRCLHFPDGRYQLCHLGVRLYHLYQDGQRTQTGGKVSPRWERPSTPQQERENLALEHARYAVQTTARRAYIQHIITCGSRAEVPSPDTILPVLQSVTRILVEENICEVARVPGASLSFWYSRRGDPVPMQQLYLDGLAARGQVGSASPSYSEEERSAGN